MEPGLINGCCHPGKPLCDRCVADSFAQLRGTAACRGEVWAMVVALTRDRSRPWWPHEGRAAELALEKVRDLSRDVRLLELLTAELARWAARWWSAPAASDRASSCALPGSSVTARYVAVGQNCPKSHLT